MTSTRCTKAIGNLGEAIACRYLLKNNLSLITKNYRSKWGEIDLIMKDIHCVIFVEVRYRKNTHYGHPITTVDQHKQKRLSLTAFDFLQNHPNYQVDSRFDVIGITPNHQTQEIVWIKNAFEVQYW